MTPRNASPVALALFMLAACAGDDGSGSSGGSTGQASGEEATGGTSGSSGADASSSTGGSGEGTSTGEGTTQGACELDVDLAVLSDHLGALATIAGALDPLGPVAVGGFLAAPGLGDTSEVLQQSLQEACTGASAFDPVCEGAACAQVVCSGEGAGWSFNAWLDAVPLQAGDFTFSELSVVVSWAEGADEAAFQIASKATRGPETWSVSANGRLIGGGTFEVVALLPDLVEGAETVLVASGGGGAFSGELEVNGVDVALVGDGAGMTPTGACW